MSNTTNLNLFKHDNPATNTNLFDIETALNENWDKIDIFAGNTNAKINQKIYYYNNVQQMKNDTKLQAGDACQTLGYYTANDGGSGLYKIVDDNTLVDNGGSIHTLNNGLRAILVIENTVNIKQFGAYGDGIHDDTQTIQKCFNTINNIYFPIGTFLISQPVYIQDNTTVVCDKNSEIKLAANSKCIMFRTTKEPHQNIYWEGGILNGNDANQGETGGQSDTSKFDFTNAFRMCQVDNLTIKDVTIKATRGHGIEHWNCNHVLFKDISIWQDYDLVHFPQGGGRRDGITGSSSNITFDNISGFTDDDLIACLVGVNWHDGVPANAENITIKNIKALPKNNVYTHSAIRIETTNGYINSNILIDGVITHTFISPIRVGGYEVNNGGLIDDITIRNVKSYAHNTYDEDSQIAVLQCHITKMNVHNCNIICNENYTSGLVGVRSAGIEKLTINNSTITVPDDNNYSNSSYCSLVRFLLNTSESIAANKVGIKHLVLTNCDIIDPTNKYHRIINYYSNENVRVGYAMTIECFDTRIPKPLWASAIKNTILNTNNELTTRYNIPCAYVKNELIDKSLQKNGDSVLDSDGNVLIYNNGVPSTINKKVYNISTSNLTQLDLNDYTSNCLIKLNGSNNNIASIINGKRGNIVTILCTTGTQQLTHSNNFLLKGSQNVTLSFGQMITFINDNDTRWIEMSRNF